MIDALMELWKVIRQIWPELLLIYCTVVFVVIGLNGIGVLT